MARKVQIPPVRIENIHGVRLVFAGLLNLLILAWFGLGVPLAFYLGFALGKLLSMSVPAGFALAALVLLAPVLWRATPAERALAALASFFPMLFLIVFFISL